MRLGIVLFMIAATGACSRPTTPTPLTTTTTIATTTTTTIATTTTTSVSTTTTVPTFRISRTKFLAFGDSITSGEVTNPVTTVSPQGLAIPWFKLVLVPSASYPTVLEGLLAARYAQQHLTMINGGQGGEAAADSTTLPRFDELIARHRPEVLLLLDGYNDLLGLGPFGVQESAAAEAMRAMVRDGRNRNARVFLATVTPNRPDGRRAIPTTRLQSFNDRLRGIAGAEGAVLVDLYAALSGDVNTCIGIDGLHPTEAGYRKMAETFFAAIRSDLEVP